MRSMHTKLLTDAMEGDALLFVRQDAAKQHGRLFTKFLGMSHQFTNMILEPGARGRGESCYRYRWVEQSRVSCES